MKNKEFETALARLEGELWNAGNKSVKYFSSRKEEDLIGEYHRGLGTHIRIEFGLWKNSDLKIWFESKGVKHPDSMSSVLIGALHRRMNGKPINLRELLKEK